VIQDVVDREDMAEMRDIYPRRKVPDPLRAEHFVTEATACGVPLLAWPRGADQRANATALESSGVRCGWSAMPKKEKKKKRCGWSAGAGIYSRGRQLERHGSDVALVPACFCRKNSKRLSCRT
jgi:hypothetical protein